MTSDFDIDLEFVKGQAERWFGYATEMEETRQAINTAPVLPRLTTGLSPRLDALIPALNEALYYTSINMGTGRDVANAFGEALTEAARSYGLNEEEASTLAAQAAQTPEEQTPHRNTHGRSIQ